MRTATPASLRDPHLRVDRLPSHRADRPLPGHRPGASRIPVHAGHLHHQFTDQVPYEAPPTGNPCRRPVEQTRTLYRSDDLTSPAAAGRGADARACPAKATHLPSPRDCSTQVFQRPHAGQPRRTLAPRSGVVLSARDGRSGDRGGYLRVRRSRPTAASPLAMPTVTGGFLPVGPSSPTDPTDDAATEAGARPAALLPAAPLP